MIDKNGKLIDKRDIYNCYGPADFDAWTAFVADKIDIAKKESKKLNIVACVDESSFIKNCESLGLVVSFKDDFLKSYYYV